MKFRNYIAVKQDDESWKYVTGTRPHHIVVWEDDMPAKDFNITMAKDMLWGLTANFFRARIEIFPDFAIVGNGNFEGKEGK